MDNLFDLLIIGAGPAGITAAIYALRANKKVLIIEKSTPGGQLMNIKQIDNYPGYTGNGVTLAINMFNQINKLNASLVIEEVIDVINHDTYKEVITNKNTYLSKNVVVATGTSYANLKINNEKKYVGNGISYCVICDGKFYENEDVMVLIDNENQLEEVNYLLNIVNKIYLVTNLDLQITNAKIQLLNNYKVVGLNGNTKLESVIVIKENEKQEIKVKALFPMFSSLPSNSFLSKYDIFASNGYMKVDENYESSVKGLFGIGDVIDKKLRQVVTACNDGAIVANYIATKK